MRWLWQSKCFSSYFEHLLIWIRTWFYRICWICEKINCLNNIFSRETLSIRSNSVFAYVKITALTFDWFRMMTFLIKICNSINKIPGKNLNLWVWSEILMWILVLFSQLFYTSFWWNYINFIRHWTLLLKILPILSLDRWR